MSYRVFISHSSFDSEVALALYTFLQDGFEINGSNVFCTSKDNQLGTGNIPHVEIIDALRETDEICYFIISPSTFDSMYCFCEMGAAWALNKDVTLIHIYPISYNDTRLQRLPFSQHWSINVNLLSDDSVREFAVSIQEKLKYKNISERANFISKRDKFINEILSIPRKKQTLIDMTDSALFHENADGKTLIMLTCLEDAIYLTYDFSTSKPEYVGYAIDLAKSDWRIHIKHEHSLMFDIEVSHPIVVNLEFKGENHKVLVTEKMELFSTIEHRAINLSNLSVKLDKWSIMTQLVFLLKPEELNNTRGNIKISNLRLRQA